MSNFSKTHIAFRVTEEEFDMISALARANHLPIGTFIKREMRQLAYKNGSRARADDAPVSTTTVIPVRPAAPRYVAPKASAESLDALFDDGVKATPKVVLSEKHQKIVDMFDDGE
jgi:hypothetical protein